MHDAVEIMANAITETPAANLKEVKRLAARLVKIEDEIKQCEDFITQAKKEREEIRIRTLPGIMFELGIDSVTIDNHQCTLEPLVQATLPKDPQQRQQAVEWLVDNGHGGIVKRELKVELPKGDAAMEDLVKDAVHDAAPELLIATTYNVHHSSYTALAKQLVKSGVSVPADLLGVYVGSIVRVDKD
jgi:hypothetical protein